MFNKPTIYGEVETITGNGVDKHCAVSETRKMERWKQTLLGATLPEDRMSHEELVLEFQSNLDKISALQSENAALQSALTAEIKQLKDELEKYNQFIAAIPWFDESVLIKDLEEIAKRCGVEV